MGGGKGLPPTLARSWGGALIDLAAPEARLIRLDAVALSLSQIKRWNGHTSRPLSVLEHSLIVGDMLPGPLRLAGLAHDAHEYMTGDGTRPYAATQGVALARRLSAMSRLPEALIARELAAATDAIKRGLDLAFGEALFLGCGAAPDVARMEAAELAHEMRGPAVKAADERAAEIEARELFETKLFETGSPTKIYATDEPDLDQLRRLWLGAIKAEAVARVGLRASRDRIREGGE
jgi:5'-deoxynucleotidase YfbR-like HD superfamily hydrolase